MTASDFTRSVENGTKCLKAAALIALIAVAASVCLVLMQFSSMLVRTQKSVGALAAQAGEVLTQAQKTVLLSGKLINDARLSADNINKAALDERFYFEKELPPMMVQAHGILANVQTGTADLHTVLLAGAGTANAATAAIQTANTSIAASKPLLDAATLAVTHADEATERVNFYLNSPELVDDGVQIHGLLAHGNAIAGDAQFEADRFTHPPPQRWYQKTWTVARQAGELLYDFIR